MKRSFSSLWGWMVLASFFIFTQADLFAQRTLIARGDVWKFQSSGTPGEAWRGVGFNDSEWRSGPSELGYGDGDEATNTLPPDGQRPVTTYFRRSFSVDNPALFNGFLLRLLRDDGAVVYLNGVEILRDNMPPGAITPETLATSTVNPDAESTFYEFSVTSAALREGANVLAVEIHQVALGSSDISFNLELIGMAAADATVTITAPREGEHFSAGSTVRIEAVAVDPKGYIDGINWYANDTKIGSSGVVYIWPPEPGTPINHFFEWKDVPAGNYALRAEGTSSTGQIVKSKPVNIVVGGQTIPLVSIQAIWEITSEPDPFANPPALIVPGKYLVTRSGSTDQPLSVRLEWIGTATPGADYETPPSEIVIPEGSSNAEILVLPKQDDIVEGDEVVIAKIVAPPAGATPYEIAPDRRSATVTIQDTTPGLPVVSITALRDRTHEPAPNMDVAPGVFLLHRTGNDFSPLSVHLKYSGTATPGLDYPELPAVVQFPAGQSEVRFEFYAVLDPLVEGDETVIATLVEPPGDGPTTYIIHSELNSATVTIVDENNGARATLEITDPKEGAAFPIGAVIPITAVAIDPNGYIARVEFFAGETRIGVSEITFFRAPDPGEPITHTIEWKNAPLGNHTLTARAVDSLNRPVVSPPVNIHVVPISGTPVVKIQATDPTATELSGLVDAMDTATFTVSRAGDITQSTLVFYSIHGTAKNGIDYEELPGTINIPAGQSSATILIVPKPDMLTVVEPPETVGLRLEPSPLVGPMPTYDIDPGARQAGAMIFEQRHPEGGALELAIPSGGERYQQGEPVEILALGFDPEVGVRVVDFYADGVKIGTSEDLNRSSSALFTHKFVWQNPLPGIHVIQAKASLPFREPLASTKAEITVEGFSPRVVLSVETIDPTAIEPSFNVPADPAVFLIRRVAGPNVAVLAQFELSGTAKNGEDYRSVPLMIDIPQDVNSVEIVINPLEDNIADLDESVIITLVSPPCVTLAPTPPECYLVGPMGTAHAQILHRRIGQPPKVAITRPQDGSVFLLGDPINIRAEASDPDGTIVRLELQVDDAVFNTRESVLEVSGVTLPEGFHTITARAVDNDNGVGLASVRILVRRPDQAAFVQRELPGGYSPGVQFEVQLRTEPPAGTDAYAVEDHPPVGWSVSTISHEGIFDAATGKVKFGPFTDAQSRTFTYRVTPPPNAIGRKEFTGQSSLNGALYPIIGDRMIEPVASTHPADVNSDRIINLAELTAYAAAWKQGAPWNIQPSPIPMNYLTRASFLWRRGEAYRFDPAQGTAPLCWVPASDPAVGAAALASASTERIVEDSFEPGTSGEVQINATPANTALSYAVEEKIPAAWEVSNISHEGRFDAAAGSIRWGPFLDNSPRTLTYSITPPAGVASVGQISGELSCDGQSLYISGTSRLASKDSSTTLRLTRCEKTADGSLRLELSGAPGQVAVLEFSTDLATWTEVKTVFVPDGVITLADEDGEGPRKFYRLRVP